jgi:hypothetical protein
MKGGTLPKVVCLFTLEKILISSIYKKGFNIHILFLFKTNNFSTLNARKIQVLSQNPHGILYPFYYPHSGSVVHSSSILL